MKKIIIILYLLSVHSLGYSQIYYQNWVSRYNGTANDYDKSNSVAVDASGNLYVTGASSGTGTGLDCVTLKYNTYGVLQQTARYNGPLNGVDGGVAIAIAPNGDIYVTGSVYTQNGLDILVIKYDSYLNQQWVRTYHSLDNNGGRSIAIDAGLYGGEVNVIVTGYRYPYGSPSLRDYVTIKYNSEGDFQWDKIYNGTGNNDDYVEKIVVDADGSSYITGYSKGNGSNYDIVTIKYDLNGDEKWIKRYNGSANYIDLGFSIALDSYANVYVTGGSDEAYTSMTTIKYNTFGVQQWIKYYYSPNYNNASGYDIAVLENTSIDDIYIYITGYSSDVSTGSDYTTIKYNSSGNEQWIRRYATSNNEDAHHIAVDALGSSYVSGRLLQNGWSDYCTISYNSDGNLKWVRTYNGPGNRDDLVNGIAIDANSNVFVTGYSLSGTDLTTCDYATIKYSSGLYPIEVDKKNNNNLNKVFMLSNESGFSVGNEGTIMCTTNGGLNWANQSSGTNENLNGIYFINYNEGYVAGDYGTILQTTNAGIEWTRKDAPTHNNLFGIFMTSESNVTVVGEHGTILNTTDNGRKWIIADSIPNNDLKSVYFMNDENGIAVGSSGVILRTTNAGMTWSIQTSNTKNNLNSLCLINSINGFAVGEYETKLYTTDGGVTWENKTDPNGSRNFYDVNFINDSTGHIVGSKGLVISTINKGLSWEYQISNTEDNILGVSFANSNVGVFSGSNGLILITTFGEIINPEKNRVAVFELEKEKHNLKKYSLSQNYPNPFNPVTKINFALPKQGFVSLKIYDITGREIKTLVNEVKQAGYYTVDFNGSSLASGVYFYRIQSGDFVSVKRMVLVK